MKNRNNEDPKLWFRSDRVFSSNSQWYFHTREGIDVGPYRTQFEAEVEADVLKNMLRDTPEAEAISLIREFLLNSVTEGSDLTSMTDYVVREGGF
jgi:hypothetical protein